MNWLAKIGRRTLDFFATLGRSGYLLARSLFFVPRPMRDVPLIIKQIYSVGVRSLLIVSVSGLFIGMVLGLEGYSTLVRFGADSALGQVVALSIIRELGPVISALLFAGRAGSSLTAEIGLMKATEQLASLELMAIDPLKRIVMPRFWAGIISLPILATIFTAVGILGGALVGVEWLGVDSGSFWAGMQATVDFEGDVLNGVIKSLVFAIVVTWIAVFRGFDAVPTSEGISLATTQTVVHSSLAVLGLDFVLTALMFGDIG